MLGQTAKLISLTTDL